MDPAAATVRIVGRYALYGVLASGGMATVHFGRLIGPVGFSRTVAIKRLHPQFAADPEFVAMFLDEARLAARIRHPNVVPTLDVVATSGELFLVMEYVPGESMARLVRAARARGVIMPPNITVAVMVGVLQGLHAAHEARNERGAPLGIVHRDVSPQNVLVGADGQARVLDFGVAKAAGRVQTTREGQLKGKLAYMAPEQLRGESCSRQTDIYAAAVVLWEALTGERLFRADNEGAVVAQVLAGTVVLPSSVTTTATDPQTRQAVERLDAIVMRGLAREPAARFETARSMALALERALAPATASQVSEWVEGIANDVLLIRAAQIAEIESSSASVQGPVSSSMAQHADDEELHSGVHGDRMHGLAPRDPHPGSMNPGPLPVDRHSAGGLSSLSVASNSPRLESLPPRRPRGLTLAAVFALLVLVPVAMLAILRARAPQALPPPPVLGNAATSPPGTSGDTPRPPGASATAAVLALEPSAPPAPVQPVRSSGDSLPEAAPPRPTAAPPNQAPATKKAAPARANACNPPFTYDGAGMKHYKPECL